MAAALAAMSVLAESAAVVVVADDTEAEFDHSCFENKQSAVDTPIAGNLAADNLAAGNLAVGMPVEDTMAGSKPAVDKLTVNRLEKGMMNVNSYSLNCVNLRMNRPNVHGTPRQRFLRTWQKMH